MHAIRFTLALAASGVLLAGSAAAQARPGQTAGSGGTSPAPTAAASAQLPNSPVWIGTVRIPVRVMADGQALAPGTYRVRLTGEHAKDEVAGQTAELERWVEFVQGSEVKGRALAPVVPSSTVQEVAETAPPGRGNVRAERLRDDNYYRLWFNHGGDQILVYLEIA